MTPHRWLLVVLLLIPWSLCGEAESVNSPPLQPELPPITDANPSVREEQEILVPAGFTAARVRDMLALCMDAGPLDPIKLKVGLKMVLGISTKTYIYMEGMPRPKNPS